ncbi:MAG TPA: FAD-dependent oxidoreductase [Pyrinomonadaceae bacterium]|nr:FAD-dependent oxidoreductase [Pyrinomonadaceae bacterium]
MSRKPITVVGAGFSGLVTAYLLSKAGREVRVIEKNSRAGGLIQTIHTKHGLVETAANGILNSARLEAMCADIGVPLLSTRRDARKRLIFRAKPRQLPLKALEAVRIPFGVAANATRLRPQPCETIAAWGRRVVGNGATDYLLTPALGGIYAGDADRLSASLIFGSAALPAHLQTYRPAKARARGTVAPPRGMQQLIDGLRDYLESQGVEIVFQTNSELKDAEPTVVCLPANAASAYLKEHAPDIAARLARVEMLSLLTVTCFFDQQAAQLKGFGCLFPRDQGFRARGVLFNDCIFEGRGPAHAETWIFGGALDGDIVELADDQIRETLLTDRDRFYGRSDTPLATEITRWPNALPHYSIDLERTLSDLPAPPPNTALVGNYLGRIGLAKILERAAYVVETVAKGWS